MNRTFQTPAVTKGRPPSTVVVIVAFVAVCLAAYYPVLNARYVDFRAFYCAGRMVLIHADPYREHPLRECERDVRSPGVPAIVDDITVPVPFPGYVLAVFAAFAVLPFPVAAALWLGASLAALWTTLILTTRVTGVRLTTAAIVLAFPTLIVALPPGQLTPFIGLAMLVTATFLAAGKPRTAASTALLIALEPHVALPVFLALVAGEPRTRATLAVGSFVLVALSLSVVGLDRNIEYIRDVLPAHALANVPDLAQYSAAHLAYSVGISMDAARTFGSVWYAAAVVAGALVALHLRRHLGGAALVLVPPAFALLGGVHVHAAQLALAIPGFLLASRQTKGKHAVVAGTIFVAAMPWMTMGNYPMLVPALGLLAIVYAQEAGIAPLGRSLALGAAAVAIILFRTSFIGMPDHAPPHVFDHRNGNPLAEASWTVAVLQHDGYSPLLWFEAAKAPTFIAFSVLLSIIAIDVCLYHTPLRAWSCRRRIAAGSTSIETAGSPFSR